MQKSIAIFFLATLLVCCGKSESTESPTPTPTPDPDPEYSELITLSTTTGTWSKVTDSSYESGDKVGLYVVNYSGATAGTLAVSGNQATNECYSYNGTSWSSTNKVYWLDAETNADFYCYYPYTSTVSSITALPCAVATDQSTAAAFKGSELMWGKATGVAPTSSAVSVVTNHIMSTVIVKLVAGSGYTDTEFSALEKQVVLSNTKIGGTLNLSTGVVTATGSSADITPLDEESQYRALVVPQTISGVEFVKVTIEGIESILTTSETFLTNTQHTCTVTVDKVSDGLNIGIGGWESSATDFGGTAQ